MSRSVVRLFLPVTLVLTLAAAARAQTAPATQPPANPTQSSANPADAERKPPPEPPRVKLAELLHVELRDRKLSATMTPPAPLDEVINAGRSVPVNVAESDDSGWELLGSAAGRGTDGAYEQFGIKIPDLPYDRWSPLR